MPHPNVTGRSSLQLLGSGSIKSTPGKVHSITVLWGTTVQSIIRLRDGGASGTIVFEARKIAQAAVGDITDTFRFPGRLAFGTDIYYELNAGTSICYIIFE